MVVAGANKRGLTVGLWLKRKINSARFTKVETYPPKDYVYKLRITGKEDLDEELLGWLRESYLVGHQLYKE